MIKLKKLLALLMCICIMASFTYEPFVYGEDVRAIHIKGTDSHDTDYKGIGQETTTEILNTLGIKSGKDTPFPEGGIGVTYTFDVQTAGVYKLNLAASLHNFPQYLSSYAVSVNGGEFIRISEENAGSSSAPNGGFGASNLIGIYNTSLFYKLNRGKNTVSVYATSARKEDSRIYYFIEYIDFVPSNQLDSISMAENINLFAGSKITPEIKCCDSFGEPLISDNIKISYKSGNSDVARVSDIGEIQAVSPGETTVTVTAIQGTIEKSFTSYIKVIEYSDVNITPLKPLGIFTENDEAEFDINYSGEFSFSIKDYFGNYILNNVAASEGKIKAGRLKSGHYSLFVNGMPMSEFSVVRPHENRRNNDNSPFASDMASVFLVNKSNVSDYARAVYLAGINQIRERMRWNVCNPKQGEYDFTEHDIYYNAFAEYGIKILNMYHSAPSFAKKNTILLPDDLKAAYDFAKKSAEHYNGIVNVWEIWNEPDIDFTDASETADKYASLLKAMSIGYKDSGADVDVSIAGIAYEPEMYVENLMKNDIQKYIDIYNYHVHRNLNIGTKTNQYPSRADSHNNLMEEYGLDGKKIWVSEAGMFIPYENGSKDLSTEQQKLSARYLATSAVEGLACGEDKHFWFVMPYYSEGGKSLGSFSSKNTPYASYNAAAAVSDALGNGEYEGQICGLPEGVKGYSFTDGEDSVAALWSESETAVRLITNTETAEMTNIMGNRYEMNTDNGILELTTGPDIIFIRINGRFPTRMVDKKISKNKEETSASLAPNDRIVISQTYPEEVRDEAKRKGYRLNKNTVTYVSVDVYNFNSEKTTARVTAKTYGGWNIAPQSVNVSLEPNTNTTLTFRISSDGTPGNSEQYPVVIGGTTMYGDISNSVAYITSDESTEIIPDLTIKEYTNSSLWKKNAPLGTGQQFEFGEDYAKFSVYFPETITDRWVYPKLNFGDVKDFSDYDGIAVVVDADEAAAGSVFRMYLNEKSGSSYYTATGYKLNLGRQQILIPWDAFAASGYDENSELDIHEIVGLQAGMNAKSAGNSVITMLDMGLYTIGNKGSGSFESLNYSDGELRGILTSAIIKYKTDSARVIADGKEYKAELKDNIFICNLPLLSGKHQILACVDDESGTVIKKRILINSSKYGLECEKLSVSDNVGNEVYTLKNKEQICVSARILNKSGAVNKFSLIAAVYDNEGKLLRAEQGSYSLEANAYIDAQALIETEGGAYVKIFIWNKNQKAITIAELID